MTKLLNLFLDSNILVHHFCDANNCLCAEQLLEKIGQPAQKDYSAYVSDFVYSESLGEMKCQYENKHHLSYKHTDATPIDVRERMVQAIEDFKKSYNINSVKIPLDQLQIYDRVRHYCFQTKDAPIVLSVEYLNKQLGKEVCLVTGDVNSLYYKAGKIVKTLHPSFHFEFCPKECGSYSMCSHKNRFTSPKRKLS